MKPLKKHHDYIRTIYLPLFLIALALAIFSPQQILLCFRVHWLILLFSILIALSPIGKIRLGKASDAIKFSKWLLLSVSAFTGMTLIFWGLIYVVIAGFPINVPLNISQPSQTIIVETTKNILLTWGSWPWFIFILLGIGLAYVGFVLKKPGIFSTLLQPIFKNGPEDVISLSTDFFARTMAHFSLAFSIGIMILLTVTLLTKIFTVTLYSGLNFATLLIATFLLVVINTRQWQRTVRSFVAKIPLMLVVFIYIIIAAISITIANYLATLLIENVPQAKQVLLSFSPPHWQSYWQLLVAMVWLMWTPLMAGFIATLARGLQIRAVIFGSALVIILINVLMTWLMPIMISHEKWQWVNLLLPWLGFAIIAIFFMRRKNLPYQIRAVVPGTQFEKQRSILFYSQSLLQTATFIVILYLPLGIYTLSIFSFVMVFPMAAMIAAITLSIAKILISKSL